MGTNLLIRPVLWVQPRLEEISKDDATTLWEQVLRAAYCTAQVLAHQLHQDIPEVALVLVINQAVMEDAHALMQPQTYQSLLAAAMLGTDHQHTLRNHHHHLSCIR